MYEWIWHLLPGSWWLKLIIFAAAIVVILALLGFVIFPWVSDLINGGVPGVEPPR